MGCRMPASGHVHDTRMLDGPRATPGGVHDLCRDRSRGGLHRVGALARWPGFPDGAGRGLPVMIGGMGTSADAGDAPAAQGDTPSLPEPTGPCPVGTTSLCLTDTSRPDPWAAGVSARELMVSLWYPAVPSDGRRAQYMTPAESELQLTSRGINAVPPDALSTVRTNAVSDATPAGIQRSLPPRGARARLHQSPQHAHRAGRGPGQPRLRRGRN